MAPGNEAEWAKINEEKEQREAEFARTLSVPERLDFGQKLYDQAFKFYNAVHASDPGPRRDSAGSDLLRVVVDADASALEHIVIGDLAVIAYGHLCAARDSKILVSDEPRTDEAILRLLGRIEAKRSTDGKVLTAADVANAQDLRVDSRHGVIDIVRGGRPPLDYETVAAQAVECSWRETSFRVASLRGLVGFKRLANRGQDRVDLEKLERVNGELPIDPIPSLDED